MFSTAGSQAQGAGPPANDLQSQLNDMLDDSASDSSSTLQPPGALNPSLRPAPPPSQDRPQDRAANSSLVAKTAALQQMLSISDNEAEIDMQDMQMLGQESNQQQMIEMSNQLQVSVMM